jgi:hypothetical protein
MIPCKVSIHLFRMFSATIYFFKKYEIQVTKRYIVVRLMF